MDQVQITSQVRRHAGEVATRVATMRQVLDTKFAGQIAYDSAVRNLSAGVEQLKTLAEDFARGGATARQIQQRAWYYAKKKKK